MEEITFARQAPNDDQRANAQSVSSLGEQWRHNREKLVAGYQAGMRVVKGRPAHMKIELTNFCNLACPMCPHRVMQREQGYMKPEVFRRIIDDAAPYLEFAYLHHLGESLFHPRVGELIAYGKTHGARIGLSTNATILDDRKSRAILENGLDFLVISLDAASADTYQQIRVHGDFRQTMNNIDSFLNLKEKLSSPTQVVTQLIVTTQHREELEAFERRWNGSAMIKIARDWGGQLAIQSPQASFAKKQVPCKMLWTEMTVLWDGAVVPCVNVFERQNLLGDFQKQSLDEIWNGEPMKELRAKHVNNDLQGVEVCATCPRHGLDCGGYLDQDQFETRVRHYLNGNGQNPAPGLS